jgi:uncharacterized protein YceK
MKKLIITIAVVMLISGCGAGWGPNPHGERLERLAKTKIGMSKAEFKEIWANDNPWSIHRTVRAWGVSEQWVYRGSTAGTFYFYFENGTLTGWQD